MKQLRISGKKICLGPILGILTLVCSLGVSEAVVRLVLPRPSGFELTDLAPLKNSTIRKIEDNGLPYTMTQMTAHGNRLVPSVQGIIRNHVLSHSDIEMKINSLGLRYEELGTRPSNESRILMLGDSITLADYASAEETIPGFLEKDYSDVRFINGGVATTGTSEQLYRYLEVADSVEASMVVVGMFIDDSREAHAVRIRAVPPPLSYSRLLTVFSERIQFLRDKLYIDTPNGKSAEQWRLENAWKPEAWRSIGASLKLMKRAVESRGQRLSVFLFPLQDQVYDRNDETPQKRFIEMCQNVDVPCLDLLPLIKTQRTTNPSDLYFDFCHMTVKGNRLVADLVGRWLDSLYPELQSQRKA